MANEPPRIAVTTGEPAGIGPDIVLRAAAEDESLPANIIAIGDRGVIESRARVIGATVELIDGDGDGDGDRGPRPGALTVIHRACPAAVSPGELNPANSGYVIACIDAAVDLCLSGAVDAMVTGPVNKAAIAGAGIAFMGHTEWIADRCGAKTSTTVTPVMMLVGGGMKICLLTTHIPLAQVPRHVTRARLAEVITVMRADLRRLFGIAGPRIGVCGLNPHAGEAGCIGREEVDIIGPALDEARAADPQSDIIGPLPADTAFTPARMKNLDALLALYHDQGLPAFKRANFGGGVNLTLGLPIIRASVDHGSALELAGAPVESNRAADASSLRAAIELATALSRRAGDS